MAGRCAQPREQTPDGATQTASPCAHVAPSLLPDVTDALSRANLVEHRIDRVDQRAAPVGAGPGHPNRVLLAAKPVGTSATDSVRSACSVAGSIREMVWSSWFAIHTDPEPNVIAPGRVPTGTAAMTLSLRGSITATELAATRTEPAPEPDSLTAAATSAASRIAAAAAITRPDEIYGPLMAVASTLGRRVKRGVLCQDRSLEFLSRGPGSRPSCSTIAFRASRSSRALRPGGPSGTAPASAGSVGARATDTRRRAPRAPHQPRHCSQPRDRHRSDPQAPQPAPPPTARSSLREPFIRKFGQRRPAPERQRRPRSSAAPRPSPACNAARP